MVISYGFIVTDNDDPSGARCDHTVESMIYELRVVGSTDGGGRQLCEPCTVDAQCGGDQDVCLFYGEGRFCGRFCHDELEQSLLPGSEFRICQGSSIIEVDVFFVFC